MVCFDCLKEHEAYPVLLNFTPKDFTLSQVKGHQDDFKTWDELTVLERLNKKSRYYRDE